jgi:hypothetical protein
LCAPKHFISQPLFQLRHCANVMPTIGAVNVRVVRVMLNDVEAVLPAPGAV